MTAAVAERTRQGRSWLRPLLLVLLMMIAAPVILAGAVWAYGPYWISPVEDFAQGPGGAEAYVSLVGQMNAQYTQFTQGGDLTIRLTESEFSGMLSSALLSGHRPSDPIQKVRGGLSDGEIRVETVLALKDPRVPLRWQGPAGLKLRLSPAVSEDGLLNFRITRAAVGRIPVPVTAIRMAGRLWQFDTPGFDASSATISLPVSNMVGGQLGRQVNIKKVASDHGRLTIVISMGNRIRTK